MIESEIMLYFHKDKDIDTSIVNCEGSIVLERKDMYDSMLKLPRTNTISKYLI
jgi:hypothetical protein